MTINSTAYALLAKDSYSDPDPDPKKREITLGGVKYKIVDHEDNSTTGFQATAYQRVDTGEVVIAFRGTEFDREPVHDGVVDVGMALAGVNAQAADAEAFTKRVLKQAKADAQESHLPLNVTVTGHSLGGTLAQLEAHKLGLRGETFNAFFNDSIASGMFSPLTRLTNASRLYDSI